VPLGSVEGWACSLTAAQENFAVLPCNHHGAAGNRCKAGAAKGAEAVGSAGQNEYSHPSPRSAYENDHAVTLGTAGVELLFRVFTCLKQAVVLDSDLINEAKFGLDMVDVPFFIGQKFFKQFHRHIVRSVVTRLPRFHVENPSAVFGLEIALEHLLEVLADR
jgi:hypothetical protein